MAILCGVQYHNSISSSLLLNGLFNQFELPKLFFLAELFLNNLSWSKVSSFAFSDVPNHD